MLSEKESKQVAEKVLRLTRGRADEAEVTIFTEDAALTRFANNEIHQNVAQRGVMVMLRSAVGGRYGVTNTNDLSDAGLEASVAKSVAIAKVLPASEEFMSLPDPKPLATDHGFSLATAEFGPLQRAAGVRVVCEKARDQGMNAAGAFRSEIHGVTIASTRGVMAQHTSTTAELSAVVMSDDSSGHAGHMAVDVSEISPESLADEVVGKAVRSRRPRSIDPGTYEVVLEPYAAADLLDFLGYLAFGALAVQEGRSLMAGKLGQRVMGANVSIWDDGLDPSTVTRPFDFEGMPKTRVDLIKDGIAMGPVHDRKTAAKEGKESTGHALPPGSTIGPIPMHMFLKPGGATHEQLVRSVKRGLLITRFWYTRVVHPLTLTMTGMTRDGTFLIENGEIVAPVKNLRFTQSYLEALNHVDLIGAETKLIREFFAADRMPAIKISEWHFTGATEY